MMNFRLLVEKFNVGGKREEAHEYTRMTLLNRDNQKAYKTCTCLHLYFTHQIANHISHIFFCLFLRQPYLFLFRPPHYTGKKPQWSRSNQHLIACFGARTLQCTKQSDKVKQKSAGSRLLKRVHPKQKERGVQ